MSDESKLKDEGGGSSPGLTSPSHESSSQSSYYQQAQSYPYHYYEYAPSSSPAPVTQSNVLLPSNQRKEKFEEVIPGSVDDEQPIIGQLRKYPCRHEALTASKRSTISPTSEINNSNIKRHRSESPPTMQGICQELMDICIHFEEFSSSLKGALEEFRSMNDKVVEELRKMNQVNERNNEIIIALLQEFSNKL
ncbi:hypothetical protein M422DRAFT_43538 [Sphaerobolus stellatus SS14]|nr:hypothetical protein M422DRAFT_43538 [Sphaerobolus stellatus SS14]